MSAKLDRAGLEGVMQPLLRAIDDALRQEFGLGSDPPGPRGVA